MYLAVYRVDTVKKGEVFSKISWAISFGQIAPYRVTSVPAGQVENPPGVA